MDAQPHGYDFDLAGESVSEYECPICFSLLSETVELPCTHLMCRECLMYNEEKALKANPNANFSCPNDRQIYQRHEKKRNIPLDRIITNSIKIKCKQWNQTCQWTGTISNYQEHHCNVCDWIEVECCHEGCDLTEIRKQILTHQSCCKYRPTECEYCEELFPIYQMKDHQQKRCPSFPVPCRNPGCKKQIQRKYMDLHCTEVCIYEVFDCPFHEVGCIEKLQRYAVTEHCERANNHHTLLLLKNQTKQANKIEQLENDLISSKTMIEELNEKVNKQSETIKIQEEQLQSFEKETVQEQESSEDKVFIQRGICVCMES